MVTGAVACLPGRLSFSVDGVSAVGADWPAASTGDSTDTRLIH
jgi:hypothetical protein